MTTQAAQERNLEHFVPLAALAIAFPQGRALPGSVAAVGLSGRAASPSISADG